MLKQKVIVTGATSFIGVHLIQRFVKENYDITAVVRPGSNRIDSIKKIGRGNIKIIELELNDYPLLYQYIENDIDCLIPLTWAGTCKEERDDLQIQKTCTELLVQCVENIIENCLCKNIITPGSVAEYGSHNKTHKEDMPCYPDSEYGKGKLSFNQNVERLCQQKGITYYHMRIFSIYGPDDYERKVINTAIKKLLLNENYHMSSCMQQWNLLYIDDLVELFLIMMAQEIPMGCYNVGSNENYSLRDYIERIEDMIPSKGKILFGENQEESEYVSLACDIKKILDTGKWKPKVGFDDGIQKVIAYISKKLL